MKKKRICYIINSVKRCGPVNILVSMIKGINLEKFDVTLITLLNDNDKIFLDELKKMNIEILNFNYPKKFLTMFKKGEISSKIDNMNFDVIHVHGHITAMLVKSVKTKKVITVHNKMYEDFKSSYGRILGGIITIGYIQTLKKFDRVICCSESSFNVCKKYIKDISYVRNGMYIEKRNNKLEIRNNIRKQLNIPNDAVVYIYAGVYSKRKNVLEMLSLFQKKLEENEYLICLGNGELFDEAKIYNSKNIIQLGFVENVIDYMISSDIYTSFSTSEGLPVSIIEALNSGLLLLLSNIDSHREIVNIDKTMYIGEIFDDDFSERKKIVSHSKRNDSTELQKKYLSEKSMMKLYEQFY